MRVGYGGMMGCGIGKRYEYGYAHYERTGIITYAHYGNK